MLHFIDGFAKNTTNLPRYSVFCLFRYRLIRHVWSINVHESVSIDATCTLDNIRSPDIGLDVYVKNMNQVHHPLITEIFLGRVDLFCPAYKLNSDKVNCK